jgi:hypothetical protein
MAKVERHNVSDFFKVRPPPPRPPPPTINPAEFIALRTIVMSLVATMANQYEESGAGIAQEWINHIAAHCQEAILAADISINGGDAERMRREAMEHVNHILGGIRPAIERGDHN